MAWSAGWPLAELSVSSSSTGGAVGSGRGGGDSFCCTCRSLWPCKALEESNQSEFG